MDNNLVLFLLGAVIGTLVSYLFTKLTYQNLLLVKQIDTLANNQREVAQFISDYPTPEEMAEKIVHVISSELKMRGFDLSSHTSTTDNSGDEKKIETKILDYTG